MLFVALLIVAQANQYKYVVGGDIFFEGRDGQYYIIEYAANYKPVTIEVSSL